MNVEHSGQWPAGYKINPRVCDLSHDLIEKYRQVPVAVAGDCMGRCVGAIGLRPYHGDIRVSACGPAVTVRVRPGDNLMIHKAMLMAKAGDVIVVDGAGDLTQALVGGLMRATAIQRRLGGFVIDGAIRDLVEWLDGAMPVFAKGHTHRGPSKDGPGEINVPVSCAGLVVAPGDLLIADADGVIAVPALDADRLHARILAHLEREKGIRATNEAGTADPERFNAVLRGKGLPV